MREDSDIKLVQALDKCENLQKENKELKRLIAKMQHCDDKMWEAYMDKIDELELDNE